MQVGGGAVGGKQKKPSEGIATQVGGGGVGVPLGNAVQPNTPLYVPSMQDPGPVIASTTGIQGAPGGRGSCSHAVCVTTELADVPAGIRKSSVPTS